MKKIFIIAFIGLLHLNKVNAQPLIITTIAGTGAATYTGDNGLATACTMDLPTAVASDTSGNLFIADRNNGCIRKIKKITGIITTVAGGGNCFSRRWRISNKCFS